jgi:hypothetical protein
MTSQEAILKLYNYKLKTAFLGVPRPVVEAPVKKFLRLASLIYGFRDVRTARLLAFSASPVQRALPFGRWQYAVSLVFYVQKIENCQPWILVVIMQIKALMRNT